MEASEAIEELLRAVEETLQYGYQQYHLVSRCARETCTCGFTRLLDAAEAAQMVEKRDGGFYGIRSRQS